MPIELLSQEQAEAVDRFVLKDHAPKLGQARTTGETNALWERLRELGTELWLDTGSREEAADLWSPEFSALTTNNTLLNREVQKGTYDDLVQEAASLLDELGLNEQQRKLELAYILNARHGLMLVEEFDARVSVEEHTDLADDVRAAVHYAQRYHALCPERFIVKIPFTPAGLLATRKVCSEGIAVNHTLGFSARQNYIATRLAQPSYVNVFMGRLNSFVASNDLGSGDLVGERATQASQTAVAGLRQTHRIETRQIGASFRAGSQVQALAGMDVMTMPPKVAREFLDMGLSLGQLLDQTSEPYDPDLDPDAAEAVGIESLWAVPQRLADCLDALDASPDVDTLDGAGLVTFFREHRCGDILPAWTDEQVTTSREEGKIPKLENWRDALKAGEIGLDALMNLAGLNAFTADQAAMDERVGAQLRDG